MLVFLQMEAMYFLFLSYINSSKCQLNYFNCKLIWTIRRPISVFYWKFRILPPLHLALLQDMSRDSEKSLSPKQCAVIDMALGTLKDCFNAFGTPGKSPTFSSLANHAHLLCHISLKSVFFRFVTNNKFQWSANAWVVFT